MNTEILNLNGERYAVIPYADFEEIMERLEDIKDIADAREIEAKIASGDIECFPRNVVDAIMINDENAIKVFREYRGITQEELANKIGKSVGMIRKLESGESDGSISTIKAISAALNIDVELLI